MKKKKKWCGIDTENYCPWFLTYKKWAWLYKRIVDKICTWLGLKSIGFLSLPLVKWGFKGYIRW